jgi:transposase
MKNEIKETINKMVTIIRIKVSVGTDEKIYYTNKWAELGLSTLGIQVDSIEKQKYQNRTIYRIKDKELEYIIDNCSVIATLLDNKDKDINF